MRVLLDGRLPRQLRRRLPTRGEDRARNGLGEHQERSAARPAAEPERSADPSGKEEEECLKEQ